MQKQVAHTYKYVYVVLCVFHIWGYALENISLTASLHGMIRRLLEHALEQVSMVVSVPKSAHKYSIYPPSRLLLTGTRAARLSIHCLAKGRLWVSECRAWTCLANAIA